MAARSTFVALAFLLFGTAMSRALAETEAAAAAANRTATAETGNATLSPADQAKRQAILDSDRFVELRMAFEDWLSVQSFYTPEQIPGLRASFRKKIAEMTPQELELFLRQSEAKLAILMSPEAIEARNWLGHFVSATAVLPASEVQQWDIVNMTPAQVEQSLRRVQSRRASRANANQAFQYARESSVRSTTAAQSQQRAESARQRAQSRSSSVSGGSPYAPPPRPAPRQLPERPRPRMFVGPGGPGFVF